MGGNETRVETVLRNSEGLCGKKQERRGRNIHMGRNKNSVRHLFGLNPNMFQFEFVAVRVVSTLMDPTNIVSTMIQP